MQLMRNAIYLCIQFVSLLSFGMFWHKVLKWNPEESVCMAIVSAIAAIFVGAIFGKAQLALVVLSVVSLVGLLWVLVDTKDCMLHVNLKGIGNFFSPGIVLLCGVFAYGVVSFHGLLLCNWDELHQWGKSVRYMLDANALPYGDAFDGEDVLLSSTTIFHYYFCKIPKVLLGKVVECNMYTSNIVLWFSAVILPLSGCTWRQWKRCFVYAAIVFLSMNIFFVQPYYNIYCDQALCMWSGALVSWNIFCKRQKHRGCFILLAVFSMALFKNMMGPLFTLVVLLSMLVQYWIEGTEGRFTATLQLLKNLSVKKIVYSISCVCAVLIPTLAWSRVIGTNALVRGDGIIKMGNDRLRLTVESGISKLFQPVNLSNNFPNITYISFCLITIVLGYLFSKRYLYGMIKKQYQVLIALYSLGFFFYFVLMIYTYLTTFSYADSIVTGSLHRYFSDYMMIGIIPLFSPIFKKNDSYSRSGYRTDVVLCTLLLFFVFGTTNGFSAKFFGFANKTSSTYMERKKFDKYEKRAVKLMDSDEKIYMVNQDSNGFFTVVADYVFEKKIDRSGMCYYFANQNPNIAGLSWANIRALPEILRNGYEYLWIYKTDKYFSDHAFSVLKIRSPQNGDFYKVETVNDRVVLRYLGNLNEDVVED